MFSQAESESNTKLTAVQKLGLCVNCDNVGFCVHSKDRDEPVWHCNEYYVNGYKKPVKTIERATNDITENNLASEVSFKGLCSNCEKRLICVFAKESSGVWHCEEYE